MNEPPTKQIKLKNVSPPPFLNPEEPNIIYYPQFEEQAEQQGEAQFGLDTILMVPISFIQQHTVLVS